MPFRKFRGIEEMGGPIWYRPGDPALYRAIRRVWGLAHRILQTRFPPGVHKHRSVEDMDECRRQWEDANLEAYHERREREMQSSR